MLLQGDPANKMTHTYTWNEMKWNKKTDWATSIVYLILVCLFFSGCKQYYLPSNWYVYDFIKRKFSQGFYLRVCTVYTTTKFIHIFSSSYDLTMNFSAPRIFFRFLWSIYKLIDMYLFTIDDRKTNDQIC